MLFSLYKMDPTKRVRNLDDLGKSKESISSPLHLKYGQMVEHIGTQPV